MRVLIKNGTVVNADGQAKQDLLIESGIVRQLGNNISPQLPYEEIDATGCYVFPGGVDVHTHFNIDVGIARSCDDFFTGTRAAACGGQGARRLPVRGLPRAADAALESPAQPAVPGAIARDVGRSGRIAPVPGWEGEHPAGEAGHPSLIAANYSRTGHAPAIQWHALGKVRYFR